MFEIVNIVEKFLQNKNMVTRTNCNNYKHTMQAGSNGSYFLLLIFSNSSLNCSKICMTSELNVLPFTPKQKKYQVFIRLNDFDKSCSSPPISTFSRRKNSAAV